MKKLSIAFALLVIVSILLTACQAQTEEIVASIDAASSTEAPAEAAAPAEEAEAPAAADEAPAQIGMIAPMEGSSQLTDSTSEASAAEIASLMKLAEGYQWEAWSLPAETTWDDVYAYYNQQAVDAGWSSDAGSVKDVGENKLAVYGKADGTKFVIIFMPKAEEVQVMAVAGK